ncbi:minor tail protein [Microbacterium phage Cece]|nr:minor tail protein [Microbacterium phage Cece]
MALSNFGGGRYQIDVDAAVQSQNVNNNTSTIYARIIVRRISGSGYSTNNGQAWRFEVNGVHIASGSWTYNFSNYATHDHWIWSGTWIHYHNPDGTATPQNYVGWADMDSGLGRGSASAVITPATIPRASNATFAEPFDAGSAVTVNTNRASGSFTHDIDWYFGTASGRALTNVGASGVWTVPMSLLQQIPSAESGTGKLRTHTYSNGSMIGWTEKYFQMNVPATARPSITSSAVSDVGTTSVSGTSQSIATLIGAYVQGKSLLKATISASGYEGSSIRSTSFSMDGLSAGSGGSIQIPNSGNRTLNLSATDTRNRTVTTTQTVSVLPYTLPKATAFNVRRAFQANGATHSQDENGQYIRVDMTAAVQSLLVGTTQKNSMQIRAYTKPRGAPQTDWVLRNTINHSALTYNSFFVISGLTVGVDQSVDVMVEIIDKLDKATNISVVTTAQVYQHWGPNGVGINKYHERGALDVGGAVYANNNLLLETGKVTSDWDALMAPGHYYSAAGATGAPFATDPFVGEVYFEGLTSRVIQRLALPTTSADLNLTWSRTWNGTLWSRWRRSDNVMTMPTNPDPGRMVFDPRSGRYNLTVGSKAWMFDGIFTPEFRRYRIDYSYYTNDPNGAWFRLRSNGTDEGASQYSYHMVYANSSGTPNSNSTMNVNVLGFPALSSRGHFGFIEVSEPATTTGNANQKRFQWQDSHSADTSPGNTFGGGWLNGKDIVGYDGFTIALSSQNLPGIMQGAEAWIQITAIG